MPDPGYRFISLWEEAKKITSQFSQALRESRKNLDFKMKSEITVLLSALEF